MLALTSHRGCCGGKYLLFYYTSIDNLVAHSSHDLEVINILEKLSKFSNCEIDSDNDEFIIPFNN